MDLALINLQRLICYKIQKEQTKPIISRIRLEDVKDIKRNMNVYLHIISKRNFRGTLPNKMFSGISVVCQGDFFKEN